MLPLAPEQRGIGTAAVDGVVEVGRSAAHDFPEGGEPDLAKKSLEIFACGMPLDRDILVVRKEKPVARHADQLEDGHRVFLRDFLHDRRHPFP